MCFIPWLLLLAQVLPCERRMLMYWRPSSIPGVKTFIGEGFLFTPVSGFFPTEAGFSLFRSVFLVPSGLAGFSGQKGSEF